LRFGETHPVGHATFSSIKPLSARPLSGTLHSIFWPLRKARVRASSSSSTKIDAAPTLPQVRWKLIVGVTGNPKDAGVYAITYILANPPLAREHVLGLLNQHC
jgi:hypothetical protein